MGVTAVDYAILSGVMAIICLIIFWLICLVQSLEERVLELENKEK